jgi:hypothetical protein
MTWKRAAIVWRGDQISPPRGANVRKLSRRLASRGILACSIPLALALCGCHLIDQTDIMKQPPPPAPAPPIPDPETRAALVTIDYTKPNTEYAASLATVVQAVETRRPGSLYDVVSVIGDAAGVDTARARAEDVMTTIEADGVIPARIQLGLRIEPGRKIPQVRVYLR